MALTVHFVLKPLPCVGLPVRPQITAPPCYLVSEKLARKDASVGKVKCTFAVLFSISVVSLILCSVWPTFNSLSILFVLKPLSLVNSAMRMSINALPMCLIIQPHAFVDVSICMEKCTLTVCSIIFPHPLVSRTIRPNQSAYAMLFAIQSLASVLLTQLKEVVAMKTLVIFLLTFNSSSES